MLRCKFPSPRWPYPTTRIGGSPSRPLLLALLLLLLLPLAPLLAPTELPEPLVPVPQLLLLTWRVVVMTYQ